MGKASKIRDWEFPRGHYTQKGVNHMKINILKNGDKVIGVSGNFVAVKRKNKEVDLIPIIHDGICLRVDTNNIITIGFGNSTISAGADGVSVTTF